jgi:ABC-type Fe3+/spermidine/putrescine transport system ATPase subunit
LQLESGKTACLLGPSGSGKSTLLRIIAGLESADQGWVSWQGKNLAGVPVHQRGFGLMFQDYALFPHRTVFENVAFGLRMQRLSRGEIERRTNETLHMVNLSNFSDRRVTDLSGGEQQRVALARALAPRPQLLMLDEPLGALDRTLREGLLEELRRLLRQTGITAIYVTHDQEEAFYIADRLILLHDGMVVQQGSPASLYDCPANPWAAQFFGMGNLLEGKVISTGPLTVSTHVGEFTGRLIMEKVDINDRVIVLLKPRGWRCSTHASSVNCLQGVVRDIVFREHGYRINLISVNQEEFTFFTGEPLKEGENVWLELPGEAVLIYPLDGSSPCVM